MQVKKEDLVKAVKELRKSAVKKRFKQSVELIMKLQDLDLKKTESRINELVELPNGLSKQNKVCVFATGDLASKAKKAGADLVVGREDIEKYGRDKKAARKLSREYSFFIAEAPLMPLVGKTVGSMLGPKGKMPTPVPPSANIEESISKHRRMVRVRVRDQQLIQCKVGEEDMVDERIVENIQALMGAVEGKLEKGLKNIKAIAIKTTMGKPINVSAS